MAEEQTKCFHNGIILIVNTPIKILEWIKNHISRPTKKSPLIDL